MTRAACPCESSSAGFDGVKTPSVVLVDDFDGVHLGHQCFIAQAVATAQAQGRRTVALSLSVMQPGQLWSRSFLTPPHTQMRILSDLGCDVVRVCHVQTEADCEHLVRLLQQAGWLDGLFVARTLADRPAGRALIDALVRAGKPVIFANGTAYHHDGVPISQGRIRNHLLDGDIPLVTACIGRYYEVEGAVEYGAQMGRRMGFPTANIGADPRQVLPRTGGYATFVWDGDRRYMAATNIGTNPSVSGDRLTVEAHLLDFDGDLYGRHLRVEFVRRLGEEYTFSSLDALQDYIRASVENARRILTHAEREPFHGASSGA